MATPGLGTEKSATRLHDLNDSVFVIGVPMGGKATKLNARIELHDMDFVTLFEALDEGRIDMGLAGLNKDTNRPDQVLYSDNYIDSYIVAIVHTSLVETPHTCPKDFVSNRNTNNILEESPASR